MFNLGALAAVWKQKLCQHAKVLEMDLEKVGSCLYYPKRFRFLITRETLSNRPSNTGYGRAAITQTIKIWGLGLMAHVEL